MQKNFGLGFGNQPGVGLVEFPWFEEECNMEWRAPLIDWTALDPSLVTKYRELLFKMRQPPAYSLASLLRASG